jgi:hypothetical protein
LAPATCKHQNFKIRGFAGIDREVLAEWLHRQFMNLAFFKPSSGGRFDIIVPRWFGTGTKVN